MINFFRIFGQRILDAVSKGLKSAATSSICEYVVLINFCKRFGKACHFILAISKFLNFSVNFGINIYG